MEEGRGEQRRVYGKKQHRKGFSYMDFLRWQCSISYSHVAITGSVNVT